MGKPHNIWLYWIIEPICILFRIALLSCLCYFIIYRLTFPMFHHWFFFIGANWWKNSNEPFITNASFVNAFFCWSILIFLWIQFFHGIVFVLVSLKDWNNRFEYLLTFDFYFKSLRKYIFGLN